MKKMRLLWRVIFTIFLFITLEACSNSAPYDGLGETASSGSNLNESQLFSSLDELDYSANTKSYRIGVNDLLDIKVFRSADLSSAVQVDTDGNISLPLIGNIAAAGLSKIQLEQKIAGALQQRYMQHPKVTVFIREFNSQRITLEGWVNKPDIYPITAGQVTVLQAIALGGGIKELGDPDKTVLFRKAGNRTKAYRLNIDAIRDGKMRDPYVRNNDVIVVHRSDSRYWLREVSNSVGSVFGIIRPLAGN